MAETIVVGMSGGVDSAVAAMLLKEQGHNVIGLFMHNWEEEDEWGVCAAANDFEDVKRVCTEIGIPYYTINFSKEYMERVFSYFLEEYKLGRTPNPDVLCNREIKFGPFLEYAKKLGADKIATGHYAKLVNKNGTTYLTKPKDTDKDQTYFLNQLSQQQIKDCVFPLSDLCKTQVRKLATKYGLNVAEKKDSTGICFIGERKFKQFLQQYLPATKGDIVDVNGNVVGSHDGVMYYTLGQRRGLNIGGHAGGSGERWFVVKKDVSSNRLIVSQGEGDELFSGCCKCNAFNWISGQPDSEFSCVAKFRHRQADQSVRVRVQNNGVEILFDEKQRAITPGQYAVLYKKMEGFSDLVCLGGGVIDEIF